jgi:D-glycerate 3-kinase
MRLYRIGIFPSNALKCRSFAPSFLVRGSLRLMSMSTDGDRAAKTTFPLIINTAIASLDSSIAPFMSSELGKLYGDDPDEELINNQIENYYLPMMGYLKLLLEIKSSCKVNPKEPLIIGISAPQGCGKTTMTDMIRAVFAEEGKRAVALSLDDFYLTGEDQDLLAASSKTNHAPNELLKLRGNAGTHDLNLLNNTISDLKACKRNLRLPRYDKSLRAGKGDRAPLEEWDLVNDGNGGEKDVDIVLFEGWMLGFDSLSDFTVEENGDMEAVNKYLQDPGYAQLNSIFDAWIVIALNDINYVFDW